MAHRVEPLLPLDITEATFLFPTVTSPLTTVELLAAQTLQFSKRDDDLATIHTLALCSHFTSVADFEHRFAKTMHDHDFQPGALVLVLNKRIEFASRAKCKPCYFGPMVVVSRSSNGSYHLAEVDGSLSKLKIAAFRLVLYFPRSSKNVEVTEFISPEDLAGATLAKGTREH